MELNTVMKSEHRARNFFIWSAFSKSVRRMGSRKIPHFFVDGSKLQYMRQVIRSWATKEQNW